MKRPTGGSSDLVSPDRNYYRHVLNDLVPYVLCCKGETFSTCDSYFQARPEGSEVRYVRRPFGKNSIIKQFLRFFTDKTPLKIINPKEANYQKIFLIFVF